MVRVCLEDQLTRLPCTPVEMAGPAIGGGAAPTLDRRKKWNSTSPTFIRGVLWRAANRKLQFKSKWKSNGERSQ